MRRPFAWTASNRPQRRSATRSGEAGGAADVRLRRAWGKPVGGADEGSVTLFLAISAIGLLLLAGLVVDGGAKIRAVQRADSLAGEAARAGGQAIQVPQAISGKAPTTDRVAAVTAAHAYLRAAGIPSGASQVRIVGAGRQLRVDVTITTPTIFLSLVGLDTVTARGQATATLLTGAQP